MALSTQLLSVYSLMLILFSSAAQASYDDRENAYIPPVYFLEDSRYDLSVDDVKAKTHEWQAVESNEPNFGFTESAVWLKVDLSKLDTSSGTWLMELAYPLMDRIELYLPSKVGYTAQLTGDRFVFSEREVKQPNFAFKLTSDYDLTQPVFMRVSSRDSVIAPIRVWEQNAFFKNNERRTYLFGAYYGSIISIVLYSLICWTVLKNRVFLINIVMIIGFCLIQLSLDGSGNLLLWGEYPEFAKRIRPFGISMLALGSIYLTKNYFQRDTLTPRVPYIYSIISLVAILGMIGAPFLPFTLSIQLSMITLVFALIPVLITGIEELKGGSLLGRYFVAGWFILIIGGIASVLRAFGILPVNTFTVYGTQFGGLGTMLLLTFGFTDRIRVLNKAVESAHAKMLAKEMKAKLELEEKVEQRTLDLAESNRIITQKNEAFKTLVETNALMDHEQSLQALLEITVSQLEKVFPEHKIALMLNREFVRESFTPIFHGMSFSEQRKLQSVIEDLSSYDFNQEQNVISHISDAISDAITILPIRQNESVLFGYLFIAGLELDVSEKEIIGVFVDQLNSFLKNKKLHDQLELIANKDALTDVYSRAYFDRKFDDLVIKKQEENKDFTIILIDVNGLKYVNDYYGHSDGDRLIKKVAKFLSDYVRGNDLVCRLGGDEFVVLIDGDRATGENLANKLHRHQQVLTLECGVEPIQEVIDVRFSLGLASTSEFECVDLLKAADERMYDNKKEYYRKNPRNE